MRGDVHYYKYTTEFVNHLKDVGKYQTLRITGHSLGGGLAIITGAQTNTNTVAISGVNALIARDALDPPISPDDIDLHTLNVAPRLDLIPKLDDQGALIQNIACRVSNFAPLDCHSSFRTQCECFVLVKSSQSCINLNFVLNYFLHLYFPSLLLIR